MPKVKTKGTYKPARKEIKDVDGKMPARDSLARGSTLEAAWSESRIGGSTKKVGKNVH